MQPRLKWTLITLALLLAAAMVGSIAAHLPPVFGLAESGVGPFSGVERRIALAAILFGTFLSEDLTCIAAGLIVGAGRLDFLSASAACFAGILIGDTVIFFAGYHFGRPLLRQRWTEWFISRRLVDRAQQLFHRHGLWIILITRFLPGTRTATYFSAGALHAPVWRFIGVFALAALAWTPLLVGLSSLVGGSLVRLYEAYETAALLAAAGAVVGLYLFFHYGILLFTRFGRRRLRGRWLRLTRWEYWPAWLLYLPVVAYIVALGLIRYRRPLLFTAVNPGMPHGGFLGESKGDILAGYRGPAGALPAWRRIAAGPAPERMAAFDRAMRELRLDYPVVLKPDEGQRGLGVCVARDAAAARDWLERTPAPALLQQFVAGIEYGVFHARRPSEPRGRIISITVKEQLEVTGNGSDTVESLIHAHPRAIAQLDTFLGRFADQLDRVPAAGERLALGELGTHARGALFRDGRALGTPQLEERIDAIARGFPGFHFGRFDLKAPDAAALSAGEGLCVIELNGLTSEATHIYEPGYPLWSGVATLCRQWGLAFAIARENAAAGAPVSRLGQLRRDLAAASRRQRAIAGAAGLAARGDRPLNEPHGNT
jgi:membrane protein DedA with SNARE-associated domain